MSSPILVNFGLGGCPTSLYAHRTWEKEKLGQRPIQTLRGKKTSRRGSAGQSELGAAASRKAVWWDLRLASLLTHLFRCFSVICRRSCLGSLLSVVVSCRVSVARSVIRCTYDKPPRSISCRREKDSPAAVIQYNTKVT